MRLDALVAVDGRDVTGATVIGATVRYGRADVGQQPDPASASFELYGPGRSVPVSVGQDVTVSVVAGDVVLELDDDDAGAWQSGILGSPVSATITPALWPVDGISPCVRILGIPAADPNGQHAWTPAPGDGGAFTVEADVYVAASSGYRTSLVPWFRGAGADAPRPGTWARLSFDYVANLDDGIVAIMLEDVWPMPGAAIDAYVRGFRVTRRADASSRRFAGTVTDVIASSSAGGSTARVVAVSRALGRMARRTVGDQPWPTEGAGARCARIATLAGVSATVSGADAVAVLARDVDRQKALPLAQAAARDAGAVLAEAPELDDAIVVQTLEYRRRAVVELVPAGTPTGEADAAAFLLDGYVDGSWRAWDTSGPGFVRWWTPQDRARVRLAESVCPILPAGTRVALTVNARVASGALTIGLSVLDSEGAWHDADAAPFPYPGGWQFIERTVDLIVPATGRVMPTVTEYAPGAANVQLDTARVSMVEAGTEPVRIPAGAILAPLDSSQTVGTLVNVARVRYGIAPDGGDQPEVAASDPASEARWGTYEDSRTTELATESDATLLAQRIVATGRQPAWQFGAVTVDLDSPYLKPADVDAILALRVGDRVDVDTGDGTAATFVEGWTDSYAAGALLVTLSLSAVTLTAPAPRWIDVPAGKAWSAVDPTLTWTGAAAVVP